MATNHDSFFHNGWAAGISDGPRPRLQGRGRGTDAQIEPVHHHTGRDGETDEAGPDDGQPLVLHQPVPRRPVGALDTTLRQKDRPTF